MYGFELKPAAGWFTRLFLSFPSRDQTGFIISAPMTLQDITEVEDTKSSISEQIRLVMDIGNQPTRSFSELIFKTVAILTTTTIAAGHLTTLRSFSVRDRADAIVFVLFFPLLPTLPVASLLYQIAWSIRLVMQYGIHVEHLPFYIAAVLGVRATPSGGDEEPFISLALIHANPKDLSRQSKAYDSKWLARLTVLLLFEAQAVTTVLLVVRRLKMGTGPAGGSVISASDVYNGLLAFGGSVTGLVSIGITLLNCSWHFPSDPSHESPGGRHDLGRVLTSIYLTLLYGAVAPYDTEVLAVDIKRMFNLAELFSTLAFPFTSPNHIPELRLSTPLLLYLKAQSEHEQGCFQLQTGYLVFGTIVCSLLALPVLLLITEVGSYFRFQIRWLRGIELRWTLIWMIQYLLWWYSLAIICSLAELAYRQLRELRTKTETGMWIDIMWVDSLASYLYAV